jgi:anaerobic selenocysteine-containing dehydrogenase
LDCPDTCSLSVTVEDDRVVDVRGSKANPYTAGVLCTKVSTAYPDFVHGDNRLSRPLRRIGAKGEGRFEPVSWEAALDLIYEKCSAVIDAHGPQAVVPFNYAGPHGMLADGSMDLRFFHKLGASLLDRAPLCGGIRSLAYSSMYGDVPGMPPEQGRHAKLFVVWGNNVTVSNLHLQRIIKAARENGAKLVVVDPKRIRVAEQAHLHLAINPGTDVVLAFALTNELERLGAFDTAFIERWVSGFDAYMEQVRALPLARAAEICGVPADDIRAFAKLYHELSPAAISVGNGLERNRNGGSGIRAILALPALTGKFGIPGNGLIAKAGAAFPKTTDRLQRPDLVPEGTRRINILDIPDMILDDGASPPIKALFIYNHNPVAVLPDQNRVRHLPRLRAAVAAACRGGDPGRGRVLAQHRDLPAPGGTFRLRRRNLPGDGRGTHGRGHRRRRPAASRHAAERAARGRGPADGIRRRRSDPVRERLSGDAKR